MEENYYTMKVVLLGQSCVGKSSLVLRFVQGKFIPHTEGTIGAAFLTKTTTLSEDVSVKFEIWDTAGQERYHSLAPMYYRGAQAAIIAYDITSRDTFEKAKSWVNELQEKSNPDQLVAFVANKLDLASQRAIDREEGEKYSEEKNLIYIETSAKDGTNVEELFRLLADRLPKRRRSNTNNSNNRVDIANNNNDQNKKSDCKC